MLRALIESDIPELLLIEEVTQIIPWSKEVFKQCLEAGYTGFVLEKNNRLIGFILFSLQMQEGHILNLGVHPNYQRQGLGQQLLLHALANAMQDGAGLIYLEVRCSNHPAIQLYKKAGFKQVGLRKGYYPLELDGREDALVFAKDLLAQ